MFGNCLAIVGLMKNEFVWEKLAGQMFGNADHMLGLVYVMRLGLGNVSFMFENIGTINRHPGDKQDKSIEFNGKSNDSITCPARFRKPISF